MPHWPRLADATSVSLPVSEGPETARAPMARKNTHSRVLRQLAEDLVRRVALVLEVTEDQRDELVTSLVRQWTTYDGRATLFLGGQQFYLDIARTPLNKP